METGGKNENGEFKNAHYLPWVRAELDKKANTDWTISELRAISSTVELLRREAENMSKELLQADKKYSKHSCHKESDIKELQRWKAKVINIRVAAVLSFAILLAGALAQYFTLENTVATTQIMVHNLNRNILELGSSQKDLEKTVATQGKATEEQQTLQLKILEALVKEIRAKPESKKQQ